MRSNFGIAVWLALLAAVVWMMTKTVGLGGEIAQGQVVSKEEAFAMTGGDTVSRVLEVTYGLSRRSHRRRRPVRIRWMCRRTSGSASGRSSLSATAGSPAWVSTGRASRIPLGSRA